MKKTILSILLAIGFSTTVLPMKSFKEKADQLDIKSLVTVAELMATHEKIVETYFIHQTTINTESSKYRYIFYNPMLTANYFSQIYAHVEELSSTIKPEVHQFIDALDKHLQKHSKTFNMKMIFTAISLLEAFKKSLLIIGSFPTDSDYIAWTKSLFEMHQAAKKQESKKAIYSLLENFRKMTHHFSTDFMQGITPAKNSQAFFAKDKIVIDNCRKLLKYLEKLSFLSAPLYKEDKGISTEKLEDITTKINSLKTNFTTILSHFVSTVDFFNYMKKSFINSYQQADNFKKFYAELYDYIYSKIKNELKGIKLPQHIFYLDSIIRSNNKNRLINLCNTLSSIITCSKKTIEQHNKTRDEQINSINKVIGHVPELKKIQNRSKLIIAMHTLHKKASDNKNLGKTVSIAPNVYVTIDKKIQLITDIFYKFSEKTISNHTNFTNHHILPALMESFENCHDTDKILALLLFHKPTWQVEKGGSFKFAQYTVPHTFSQCIYEHYNTTAKKQLTILSLIEEEQALKNKKQKTTQSRIIPLAPIDDTTIIATKNTTNTEIELPSKVEKKEKSKLDNKIESIINNPQSLFINEDIKKNNDHVLIRQSWGPSPADGFTLVLYPIKKKNIYRNLKLTQKKDSYDNFHKIPDCTSQFLQNGIVYKKSMFEKPKILDTFACDFYFKKNDSFAIILPGKIINQKSYFNNGDPEKDKNIQKIGHHEGAVVCIFDKNNKCTHCCFHQTRDDKTLHDDYKKKFYN